MKVIVTNQRVIPVGTNFQYNAGEHFIRVDDVDTSATRKGLGDVVAAVTKAVGIQPCGSCQKRQQALNEWWFGLADRLSKNG